MVTAELSHSEFIRMQRLTDNAPSARSGNIASKNRNGIALRTISLGTPDVLSDGASPPGRSSSSAATTPVSITDDAGLIEAASWCTRSLHYDLESPRLLNHSEVIPGRVGWSGDLDAAHRFAPVNNDNNMRLYHQYKLNAEAKPVNERPKNSKHKQLKHNDKQLRHDDKQLRHDDKQLRHDDKQLRHDDKQLRHDDKQLRRDDKQLRHNDKQLRHADEQLRHDDKQLRHDDKQLRHDDKQLRHADEQLRHDDKQLRLDDKLLQQEDEQLFDELWSSTNTRRSSYAMVSSRNDRHKASKHHSTHISNTNIELGLPSWESNGRLAAKFPPDSKKGTLDEEITLHGYNNIRGPEGLFKDSKHKNNSEELSTDTSDSVNVRVVSNSVFGRDDDVRHNTEDLYKSALPLDSMQTYNHSKHTRLSANSRNNTGSSAKTPINGDLDDELHRYVRSVLNTERDIRSKADLDHDRPRVSHSSGNGPPDTSRKADKKSSESSARSSSSHAARENVLIRDILLESNRIDAQLSRMKLQSKTFLPQSGEVSHRSGKNEISELSSSERPSTAVDSDNSRASVPLTESLQSDQRSAQSERKQSQRSGDLSARRHREKRGVRVQRFPRSNSSSTSTASETLEKWSGHEDTESGSSTVLVSSSFYHPEVAQKCLERLRMEEEHLLELKRQQELERIRGPQPKWYMMKGSQFHEELRKDKALRKNRSSWQNLLDYRTQLEQASQQYQRNLNNHRPAAP